MPDIPTIVPEPVEPDEKGLFVVAFTSAIRGRCIEAFTVLAHARLFTEKQKAMNKTVRLYRIVEPEDKP